MLRPRTREALARTRSTGAHVVVVTGRMFRAVRPYLEQAQLDDLVVCYQGAVVADPATGEFLLHVPIPLAEAREAMDAVLAAGFHLNCYVDDLLYVAEVTPEARRYADFQHLEIHAVGDLRAWLDRDPTKLVAVGDPDALDELEAGARAALRGPPLHLQVAAVLPRVRAPGREQGERARVRRRAARLPAGGDGRVRRRGERPRAARLGRLRRRRGERARGRARARRPRRSLGAGGRRGCPAGEPT